MTYQEQKKQHLHAHGSLHVPFPLAFPEEDTFFQDSWPDKLFGQLTRNDHSPCPLGHLASLGVVSSHFEENLTSRFDDAAVEISLSLLDTDDLLFPVELLIRNSPWFRAALSDRWLYSGDSQEPTPPHRLRIIQYELVFEKDGSSCLIRKHTPTPWLERLEADNAALWAFTTLRDRGWDKDAYHRKTFDRVNIERMSCNDLRRTTIESYRIGFGLRLRLRVDLRKLAERPNNWAGDQA